ncbi:hypothetical protein CHS0354_031515 [Potamilus streckersoni]|uniref:Granulins domain-containing protein n=1 Tax=Potamilus streckersoni TaxID=2493646 RepID=A0AAE0VWP3_9BIVA|nr:hypothetical protein CHS0354_031515 [Potamilus streckersoni]
MQAHSGKQMKTSKMLMFLLVLIIMVSANPFLVEQMHVQRTALCFDGEIQCPPDHECCKLEAGKIGCCLQQEMGQEMHKRLERTQASSLTAVNITANSPCSDPTYTCPGLQTCCCSSTGFGCCPYDKGICCSDGRHCCPSGKVCIGNVCY